MLLLVMGFCGQIKGFDKELERDAMMGITNSDSSIYLEKRTDFLHARISLKQPVVALMNVDGWITDFSTESKSNLDKVMASNLRRQHGNLVHKLEYIVGSKGDREKRSIEFVGNILSDLFGVAGPEDMKQNNANMLALKQAIDLVGHDSVSVHKHIDTNEHDIERNNREINRLEGEYMNGQNRFEGQMTMLENYFKLDDLLNSIGNLMDKLLQIKSDGEKGYCSSLALNNNFLQKNLQRLEANSVGLNPIFSYWEWRKYYRYQLCTIALNSHNVWVTVRLPMVKKSERLVRITPPREVKSNLINFGKLGINTVLFKEASVDGYHLMTQKAFEMCTKLGSLRTCNVRSVMFRDMNLIPLEYAHNRILFLGNSKLKYEAILICETSREIGVTTGQIINVPNQCSVKSRSFEIEERQIDENVNRILSVADNVFSKVNITIPNNSKHETNESETKKDTDTLMDITKELSDKLSKIKTEHKSAWEVVSRNLWIVSGIAGLSFVMFVLFWILCRCLKRKTKNKRKIKTNGKSIEFVESDIKSEDESADESDENVENKNVENKNVTNELGRRRNNV